MPKRSMPKIPPTLAQEPADLPEPPKWHGVDPLLDEVQIVELLNAPVQPMRDRVLRLQSGNALALIDAFDRKVDRSFFVLMIDTAMASQVTLGRLLLMKDFYHLVENNKLNLVEIKNTIEQLTAIGDEQRRTLKNQVELMSQMANSDDPIS